MTFGQDIASGNNASMCFQGAKAGGEICGYIEAHTDSGDDGDYKGGIMMWWPRQVKASAPAAKDAKDAKKDPKAKPAPKPAGKPRPAKRAADEEEEKKHAALFAAQVIGAGQGIVMVPKHKAGAAGVLKAGKSLAGTYYQPKMAKSYSGLTRYNAGESVNALAGNPVKPEFGEEFSYKPCMQGVKLTGAATLVAGAAAVGLALF